jgi:hypothetical protein
MHFPFKQLPAIAAGCLALTLSGCKPSINPAPDGGAWIVAPTGPAHIYVPSRPTPDELEAAGELARIVAEASGRPAYVLKEPFFFQKDGFYVGNTFAAKRFLRDIVAPAPKLDACKSECSAKCGPLPSERWDNVGWAVENGRIVIAGSSPLATRFAVSRFAEENCGARWWFPGPKGEDIPKAASLAIAEGTKIEKPSYVSRYLGVYKTAEGEQWLIHSALVEHVNMHHSLHALLGKDVARAHPDWFPKFNGKPYNPETQKGQGPHPNFASREAADYVAEKAIRYFDANPQKESFSISPADNTLFGDLDAYKKILRPNAAFRGKADLSNAVFTFDNNVARQVAAKYPNRFLGALSYAFYENVPDFPVEPNIIPMLTADRSQWYDPAFRAEDLALAAKWAKAGPKIIGTWDYYYGYPFLVPRVMLSQVKDSIPSLRKAGVRAFYAELSPIWGFDAPKVWMAAHLLWNSDQNADDLEEEFFRGCFGPAATDMERFYKTCDAIWMAQPGKARWIRYYGDFDQAAIYTPEDIAKLRGIIDAALAKNLPDKYRARVELVSNAFRTTERVMTAYAAYRRVSLWVPGMPVGELEAAIPAYLAARKDVSNIFSKADPLNNAHQQPGYLTDDDPLASRLALAAPTFDAETRARIASLAPNDADILNGNTSFLLAEPFADGLKNWLVTHWPNPLLNYSLDGKGRDATLSVSRANTFCLMLKARVKPGRSYGMAFGADGHVTASACVQLVLEYLDAKGKVISFTADSLPYGNLVDMPLAVAAQAPQGAATARVTLTVKYQGEEDIARLHAWRASQK